MMMIADPVFWRVVSRRDGCVFFVPGKPPNGRPGEIKKKLKNAIRTHVALEYRHRKYDNEQRKQKCNNIYQLRPTPSLLLHHHPLH